jgi:hypothetical protein
LFLRFERDRTVGKAVFPFCTKQELPLSGFSRKQQIEKHPVAFGKFGQSSPCAAVAVMKVFST